MALQATYSKRSFHFSFKARTSRGLMKDKTSWFVRIWDTSSPQTFGIGEAGPLPGLSVDPLTDFEAVLESVTASISSISDQSLDALVKLVPPEYPSIRFAIETALLDLRNGGQKIIFRNGFYQGKPLPINGLVWMGDLDFMMDQINQKITQGFQCLKLKVGGLDFERECDILQYVRKRYYKEDIEIRLDANGAFKLDDALYKLNELARFRIHSIEQPIKPNLPEMEELCLKSPIPVALDEELIGKFSRREKEALLQRLKPRYIILKPTLLGGVQSSAEWIELAKDNGIGWWITSALESSIGLNAICQFTAEYAVTIPQGLGTGSIYVENIPSPLTVSNGQIFWSNEKSWDDHAL